MGIWLTIAQLAYFMAPGYLANMAPVFARKLFPRLDTPVDLGRTLGRRPILGRNKTWRGLLAGVLVGILAAGLQRLLLPSLGWLSIYDYSQWWLLGGLLGLGAGLGDLIKSFFKRRLDIKPGGVWVPWDEIDHPIVALALASPVFFPGWLEAGLILLITFIGHIALNLIGYWLGMKDVPW